MLSTTGPCARYWVNRDEWLLLLGVQLRLCEGEVKVADPVRGRGEAN